MGSLSAQGLFLSKLPTVYLIWKSPIIYLVGCGFQEAESLSPGHLKLPQGSCCKHLVPFQVPNPVLLSDWTVNLPSFLFVQETEG